MAAYRASDRPRVTAAVLAGGTGTRLGADRPKQLLPMSGRPLLDYSLAAFGAAPEVDDIIVLMAEAYLPEVEKLVAEGGHPKVSAVLPGGTTRSESSWRAIEAVDGRSEDLVLLHDAARPLVSAATISACVDALRETPAVGVAVPASDTVVEVAPGGGDREIIARVPERGRLRRMQTPQGFWLGTIRQAYELAMADPAFQATDDCGVVLRYLPNVPVGVVSGEERNIKITHPGDIEIAAVLLHGRETS